jgi:hypothetical protein
VNLSKLSLLGSLCLAFILHSFTGCEQKPRKVIKTRHNKVVEERVFLECLKAVPQGPKTVAAAGNDWDEVVNECHTAASWIAREEYEEWE